MLAEVDGRSPKESRASEAPAVAVRRLRLADVRPESVRWLWRGYVPLGKLTLVAGDPGLSKSTFTLWLASVISKGAALPDGTALDAASSLFVTYEDGVADTLRPRAEAHGADLTKIHVLAGVAYNGEPERLLTLPDDLPAIKEQVKVNSLCGAIPWLCL